MKRLLSVAIATLVTMPFTTTVFASDAPKPIVIADDAAVSTPADAMKKHEKTRKAEAKAAEEKTEAEAKEAKSKAKAEAKVAKAKVKAEAKEAKAKEKASKAKAKAEAEATKEAAPVTK